jgi:small subunit ribosomal protein S6e
MKLNIANPATGRQKLLDIDDEKKVRIFYDKRISQEVDGDALGDEFKGYIFKITGGIDKDGFAMKQGIMVNHRLRLLLDGHSGLYRERRDGARRRKSVRGCIVGSDLAVINVIIVKRGEKEIPGLAEEPMNKTLGPKRVGKIRKFFDLKKEDDVRQFVIRRELPAKEGKPKRTKAPKIQRLVTPERVQRKRRRLVMKKLRYEKNQKEAAEYNKLVAQLRKEQRQTTKSKLSTRTSTAKPAVADKKAAPAAKTQAAAPKTAAKQPAPAAAKKVAAKK